MIHRHGPFTEQVTITKHTALATTTVRHPSGWETTAEHENVYWSRAMAWREMAVKLAGLAKPQVVQVMPDGVIRECPLKDEAVRIDEL